MLDRLHFHPFVKQDNNQFWESVLEHDLCSKIASPFWVNPLNLWLQEFSELLLNLVNASRLYFEIGIPFWYKEVLSTEGVLDLAVVLFEYADHRGGVGEGPSHAFIGDGPKGGFCLAVGSLGSFEEIILGLRSFFLLLPHFHGKDVWSLFKVDDAFN